MLKWLAFVLCQLTVYIYSSSAHSVIVVHAPKRSKNVVSRTQAPVAIPEPETEPKDPNLNIFHTPTFHSSGPSPGQLNTTFAAIYIAILASAKYPERRLAVRNTWLKQLSSIHGKVVYRFVISQEEVGDVDKEELDKGDFLVLPVHSNYTYLLNKVMGAMQDSLKHNVDFFFKTDDDTYINMPLLSSLLAHSWARAGYRRNLYIGYRYSARVQEDTSKQWHNKEFREHTGLNRYTHYMIGVGYLMSRPLVETLVAINTNVGLFWSRMEDATVGFWLSVMSVTHIDWREYMSQVRMHFNGAKELLADGGDKLCDNIWQYVMLHKVDSPEMIKFHQLFSECKS